MAFFCKKCGHALEDSDTICRHCGAPAARNAPQESLEHLLDSLIAPRPAETPKPAEACPPAVTPVPRAVSAAPVVSKAILPPNKASSLGAAAPTIPVPPPPVADKASAFTASQPPEEAAPFSPPEDDVSSPSDLPATATAHQKTAHRSDQPETPAPAEQGALESALFRPEKPRKQPRGQRILTITIVLSLVLLVFAVSMLVLSPLYKQKQQRNELIRYLQGAWISDPFAFYDSTDNNHVEVLTVDKDGTFLLQYEVPSDDHPDGWATGKWMVEYQIDGTVEYAAEGNRVLLLYIEEGENYYFDRTFIEKGEDSMTLREYYDETKTKYFDVVLRRTEAPELQEEAKDAA